MKKIIVAIDGLNYKKDTIEFAITLANHLHGHLVGLFLNDRSYHSYDVHTEGNEKSMPDSDVKRAEEQDIALRKQAVEAFEAACRLRRVPYSVHANRNAALPELVHESMYADLLIIHSGERFAPEATHKLSVFISNLLHMANCPVLLSTDDLSSISKAILLYDGSPESMYAIKSFCFLARELTRNLDVEVLSVKGISESLHLPDNKLMKEYMKRHFPKAVYTVCKGEADKKIPAILKKAHAGTIVVSGAYNRGFISKWFRPGMGDILLRAAGLPMFINHVGR